MKRKLAIGVTGLLVLGGAGAAYGITSGGKDEREAFLNDAAKRLNVSPDKLKSALQGAFEDRLDAAVKAGRLSQEEADAIKKKIDQGGGPPVGIPGFGFGEKHLALAGPIKAGLDAAANYLDLTDKQLIEKLESGKSLADVAGDQKKSVDGLKSAIKDAVKTQLDQAVKDKRLTQDQENKVLDGFNDRLDDMVNGKGFGPPPGLRRHLGPDGKRGFHFGFGPAAAPAPVPAQPGEPAGPII
jgi:hypothetical protein